MTFMSAITFWNFIVSATKPLKALVTALIIPTEAPKAITRAFEASNDLVNSLAEAVILPKGWVKDLELSEKLACLPDSLDIILLNCISTERIP